MHVSSISGKVLCKDGTGEGDRKSQSARDQRHVLEQLLMVPPVVIGRDLVWGMSHVPLHGHFLPWGLKSQEVSERSWTSWVQGTRKEALELGNLHLSLGVRTILFRDPGR